MLKKITIRRMMIFGGSFVVLLMLLQSGWTIYSIGRFSTSCKHLSDSESTLSSTAHEEHAIIDKHVREAAQTSQRLITVSLLCGLLASAICTVIVIYISRRIYKNLNRSMEAAKAMSEGDFSFVLTGAREHDEIALLTNWLSTTLDNLRQMFTLMKANILTLNYSTEALKMSAQGITDNSDRMVGHSQSAVASAGQIAQNMDVLSNSAGGTYESVNAMAETMTTINRTLSSIADQCRQEGVLAGEASEQAQASQVAMTQLDESTKTVTRIVDLISDIADKTNLLALNATIEAASAGEAGKGFAVVANEVKELARQTANATADISRQIGDIRKNSSATVEAMSRIGTAIKKVNDISQTIVVSVNEMSSTFAEVTSTTIDISGTVKGMADNIREGSIGVNAITRNISELSSAFNDLGASVNELKSSLSDMGTLIDTLSKDANMFNV
jgi:methyl-accepting chemotaxis protein